MENQPKHLQPNLSLTELKNLTSRQRLDRTLHHLNPGKVVVDLGSTTITGINANALAALRRALNLKNTKIKIHEPLQLLGMVEDDLRERLSIDVVDITNNNTMFGFSNQGWKDWTLPSGLEVEIPADFQTTVDQEGTTFLYPKGDLTASPSAKMPKGGYYFDNITRVMEEFDEENPEPSLDFKDDFGLWTDEQLKYIQKRVDYYYQNTNLGLVGGGALISLGDFALIPGPSVKSPKGIRDISDFMVAHYTMPDYIKEVFSLQVEVGLKNAAMFYQAVGNKVQVMQISATDFGTQRGAFMSRESYQTFYQPFHKQVNDWVHQNTKWKTFFHSCGSIVDFLPDFYEAGVDILNPVQTSAHGMDAVMLKEKWGDKFVFWGGGIDTQNTLPFKSPSEVYEEATKMLEIFSVKGGYVFNTVHNIQGPTPVENLMALYQAVQDFKPKYH